MIESSFWTRRLRKLLVVSCRNNGFRSHFERIENAVAVGTPDVDYCVNGVCGKIELKYTSSHPRRPGTPVLGKGKGLRKSQIVWASRRSYAGGTVFVCIGSPTHTWLINVRDWPPARLASIALLTSAELHDVSIWSTGDSPALLARILVGPQPRKETT